MEFKVTNIVDWNIIFSNEGEEDTNILTWFIINFKSCEMVFDFQQFYPSEKIETEKQLKIDYLTFLKYYLKNWTIELYDQSKNELITKSNPHFFVNIDTNSIRSFRNSIDKELESIMK